MKISIATFIRLVFILTLVAISVAAQTGLITDPAGLASGRTALDRGDSDTAIGILEKVVARNSGERSLSGCSDSASLPNQFGKSPAGMPAKAGWKPALPKKENDRTRTAE